MIEGQKIRPAEGLLLVQYLDDHEDHESSPLSDGDYEGCLAQVLAAGPKTTAKPGQVVILSPHAYDTKAPGGACLVSQLCVVGTLQTT